MDVYADRIEGEVGAFVFRAEDGGYAVLHVLTGSGPVTAVGALAHVREGQRIVANGQWVTDLRFGRRFKVESVLVEEPRTLAGLEKYLVAAVEGVGPELARRIVDTFGLDALSVLQDAPQRLTEVPGIGRKTKERIVASWQTDREGREVEVTLRGYGVGVAAIRKVLGTFGKNAMSVVSREPYRLVEVPGIGFRTADTLALANGISRDDPARVAAAIEFALATAEGDGSCFLPEAALLERVCSLGIDRRVVAAGLERASQVRAVIRHSAHLEGDRAVYRPLMDEVEGRVARRVLQRARGAADAGACTSSPSDPAGEVTSAAAAVGIVLAPGQHAALITASQHAICVITGGPGTGKTTIVRVLAELARRREECWVFASPTGRAARRLSEAAGQEARTLHRILEYGSGPDGGFARNRSNPIGDGPEPCHALLIDEASMVDIHLFDAVLDALPAKARLVLVGDTDQLPSVGPGQVLGDLMRSGVVPVARLTEVYRQAASSAIIRNAHRILAGEVPISAERDRDATSGGAPASDGAGVRDCFVLPKEDAEDIARLLVTVVTERLPKNGFDPKRDVQVLTPMHSGPLGTVALNARLGAVLNPSGEEIVRGARRFRVGDRVLQTKNDYEIEVFNGDVGRVVAVSPAGMHCDFDGRAVLVPGDALDTFEPAWAISIHKSQGSEYPAVVIVLHPAHFVMLRRNLIYTALTRARRFACFVASPRALRMAVQRTGVDERNTGLCARLR